MNPANWGPVFIVALLFVLVNCAGPMSVREAQKRATIQINDYCEKRTNCGPVQLTHTQRLQQSWLVEFDSAANAYAILVNDDGNTKISIWDKSRGASIH